MKIEDVFRVDTILLCMLIANVISYIIKAYNVLKDTLNAVVLLNVYMWATCMSASDIIKANVLGWDALRFYLQNVCPFSVIDLMSSSMYMW